MAGNVAGTSFAHGPDDTLRVGDAYNAAVSFTRASEAVEDSMSSATEKTGSEKIDSYLDQASVVTGTVISEEELEQASAINDINAIFENGTADDIASLKADMLSGDFDLTTMQGWVSGLTTFTNNETVQTLIGSIGILGGDFIFGLQPYFVKKILQVYPIGFPDHIYMDMEDRYEDLMDVLGQVDSDWYEINRNGEAVSNLYCYLDASDDALRLLATNEKTRAAAFIARSYPEMDKDDLIRSV